MWFGIVGHLFQQEEKEDRIRNRENILLGSRLLIQLSETTKYLCLYQI